MNRLKMHWEKVRSILIGAVMIGLLLFIWYSVGLYRQKKAVEAQIEERYRQEETELGEEVQEEIPETMRFLSDTVTYDGKTYRRNSYVKAILCMGVDRKGGMQETTLSGDAGQADGVFLLAQDTARNQLKILMIPRDSITEITVTDVSQTESNGTVLGKELDHLSLAYSYGEGRETSCQYMTEAVSGLLGGLKIDSYMAADTDVITTLNDAVGGVTVKIPTPGMEARDPAFVFGQQVHLQGAQAEMFVRYRDITKDNSALFRMSQQQEYITGFFQAVKEKSKEDSRIVEKLFELTEENMVTDMGKEQYMKIAMDALADGSLTSGDFRIAPGMGTATDTYDEFYVDQEALTPVLLELFYRQTDGMQ